MWQRRFASARRRDAGRDLRPTGGTPSGTPLPAGETPSLLRLPKAEGVDVRVAQFEVEDDGTVGERRDVRAVLPCHNQFQIIAIERCALRKREAGDGLVGFVADFTADVAGGGGGGVQEEHRVAPTHFVQIQRLLGRIKAVDKLPRLLVLHVVMDAFVRFRRQDGGEILRGSRRDFGVRQNALDNRHVEHFAEIRLVGGRRRRIVLRETDRADGRDQIAMARLAAGGQAFAVDVELHDAVVVCRDDGAAAAAERLPVGAVRGVHADFHAVIP